MIQKLRGSLQERTDVVDHFYTVGKTTYVAKQGCFTNLTDSFFVAMKQHLTTDITAAQKGKSFHVEGELKEI